MYPSNNLTIQQILIVDKCLLVNKIIAYYYSNNIIIIERVHSVRGTALSVRDIAVN